MRHVNEKITPDIYLSEQQRSILQQLQNFKVTDQETVLVHKIQVPDDMRPADVHYVKIEIELRYLHLSVYQRENVLLIVVNEN